MPRPKQFGVYAGSFDPLTISLATRRCRLGVRQPRKCVQIPRPRSFPFSNMLGYNRDAFSQKVMNCGQSSKRYRRLTKRTTGYHAADTLISAAADISKLCAAHPSLPASLRRPGNQNLHDFRHQEQANGAAEVFAHCFHVAILKFDRSNTHKHRSCGK